VNQYSNAPQDVRQLEPDGSGLVSSAHPHARVRGTLWLVWFAGREATVNACGVTVAMLQEQSWAPRLSNDPRVNVGTAASVPPLTRFGRLGREDSLPVDADTVGRRTRSSPSTGKPCTWRRGPANPPARSGMPGAAGEYRRSAREGGHWVSGTSWLPPEL